MSSCAVKPTFKVEVNLNLEFFSRDNLTFRFSISDVV